MRKFGDFSGTANLGLTRFIEGPTTLNDSSTIDNTSKNYGQASAGLRAGYEFVPDATAFIEGDVAYQKFDVPDPTLHKFLDGTHLASCEAASATTQGTLAAEISSGPAWRVYTDGSLTNQMGWLYDGSLTFTPDDHLTLQGGLTTTLVPSSLARRATPTSTTRRQRQGEISSIRG